MKPSFRIRGVDRKTADDVDLVIEADSVANARVKAELRDIVVTDAKQIPCREQGQSGVSILPNIAGIPLSIVEKHAILQTLELCDGNRAKAAEKLGIGQRTLYRKLNEYGAATDKDGLEGLA